jgi:NAD(P)-dependent dehydrogenase (short-subunit alcohol dehydrogenase family)
MKDDKICVITGGGSGIGLAAARLLGEGSSVILVGRTGSKLELAAAELRVGGIDAQTCACDLADRESALRVADFARERGRIAAVIHAAGLSPHMGDARSIMEANALGTMNVNDAFFPVMESGSCIVDVSSMAAYLAPRIILPRRRYPLARVDRDRFMRAMMRRVNLFPIGLRPSVAYGISKDFAIWYAKTDAARFGEKGSRVVSVSPGNFETPMGELEKDEASAYIGKCAIKRFGKPEEIARLLLACADERMGYLTGVDIVCDGGCTASALRRNTTASKRSRGRRRAALDEPPWELGASSCG